MVDMKYFKCSDLNKMDVDSEFDVKLSKFKMADHYYQKCLDLDQIVDF